MGINKDTNQERNTGQAGRGPGITGERTLSSSDYSRHFEENFENSRFFRSGSEWQDYEPAYRYGHSLASDERYGGREWEDIESDARGDWERRHPGSAWERFKDAVRHAWERARH